MAFNKKEQLSLIIYYYSKTFSKQVTRRVECFVFKLIINCNQTNNPRHLRSKWLCSEFGKFPEDYLMKGKPPYFHFVEIYRKLIKTC